MLVIESFDRFFWMIVSCIRLICQLSAKSIYHFFPVYMRLIIQWIYNPLILIIPKNFPKPFWTDYHVKIHIVIQRQTMDGLRGCEEEFWISKLSIKTFWKSIQIKAWKSLFFDEKLHDDGKILKWSFFEEQISPVSVPSSYDFKFQYVQYEQIWKQGISSLFSCNKIVKPRKRKIQDGLQ